MQDFAFAISKLSRGDTFGLPLPEGRPPPAPFPSTAFSRARGVASVAVTHIRPGVYILRASSVSETFRRPCSK